MHIRGKLVILGIFGLAIAASAFAWTFRKLESRQVLALWGGQTAAHVRRADRVFFLQLEGPSQPHQPSINIDGRSYAVKERTEITKWPGLINARAALIADASFEWTAEPKKEGWQYVLQFETRDKEISAIAFNLEAAEAIQVGDNTAVCLAAKMTAGLKRLFAEISD